MNDIIESVRGLTLDADGIWRTDRTASVSYPESGHLKCFAVEDKSFWYQHRNRCIVDLVGRNPPRDRNTIVEIGGGNGVVSRALQEAGHPVALIEPGEEGAMNAKLRGVSVVIQGTLEDISIEPESQSAVGLFDVLEHIEDDGAFLQKVRNVLKPGGRLYLTVPAWQWLWSVQDVEAGHYRRYSREQLEALVAEAGFDIDFSSYFFSVLPPPILLLRALPFRLGLSRQEPSDAETASDHGTEGGLGARFISAMLMVEERWLARGRRLPLGSSCILAASATN